MMALSVGIVLALSLWSAFDGAKGDVPPHFDNFCEVPSQCSSLIKVTFPCNGHNICTHYVLVYTACTKHEPCEKSYLSHWSECTAKCKPGGTRSRTFTCTTKDYVTCTQHETENCNEYTDCDKDGMWGHWHSWVDGPCSASCCKGTLTRTRSRDCDSPPPYGYGKDCDGSSTDYDVQHCDAGQCPLVCRKGDSFFPDTCERCSKRYYECEKLGMAPTEKMCPHSRVWSQRRKACVSDTICK